MICLLNLFGCRSVKESSNLKNSNSKNSEFVSKVLLRQNSWGVAKSEDVLKLLKSTELFFIEYLEKDNLNTKSVFVWDSESIGINNPRIVMGVKENNIYLSATDRDWSKYAYQFSHEYCHHVIDNDFPVEFDQFGWFEESICELASIQALKFMSTEWSKGNAPYENWISYSSSLNEYAEELINRKSNTIKVELSKFIELNQDALRIDRYGRSKNLTVAVNLLSIFQEHPELWNLVAKLNEIHISTNEMSFEEYIIEWQKLIDMTNKKGFNKLKKRLLG